jgi:hypothetical protein
VKDLTSGSQWPVALAGAADCLASADQK